MQFAFTDDQLAFRTPCATSSPRTARRRPCRRVEGGAGRSRACAGPPSERRWGSSASLVPEAVGGLGLTELDLVLVLEECGFAWRCPTRSSRPRWWPHRARRRWSGRRRPPWWSDSRWAAVAHGGRPAPRRRRRRGGLDTSTPPRPGRSTRRHGGRGPRRRTGRGGRPRTRAAPVVSDDPRPPSGPRPRAPWAPPPLLRRPGRPMLDLTVGYVGGAQAVRCADRQLPGGQAPPRRRRACPRVRPRPLSTGPPTRSPRRARRRAATCRWPRRMASDAARSWSAASPCSATAPSATRSSTTSTCT